MFARLRISLGAWLSRAFGHRRVTGWLRRPLLKSHGWRRYLKRLGPSLRYLGAAIVLLVAGVFLATWLWLPVLAERKSEFQDTFSELSGYRVSLDQVDAYWDGPNPGFRVRGLRISSPDSGRLAIKLDEVRVTLAWLPLLQGRLALDKLVLVQPRLAVERLADGRFQVTGLAPFDDDAPARSETSLRWLLLQDSLVVEDGEIQWVDHRAQEPPIHLSGVNFSLRNNGRRHRIGLKANFPPNVCRDCLFLVDVKGNPWMDERWKGEIYVRAIGLDSQRLPAILREYLPHGFHGRADLDLLSKWERARPRSVEGKIRVNDLGIPLGDDRIVHIGFVETDLKWKGSKDGQRWRLDLSPLRVGLRHTPWSAGRVRLEHGPEETLLNAKNLDLTDVSDFLRAWPGEQRILALLRTLRPGGQARNVRFRLVGDLEAPQDFSVHANATGVHFAPYEKFPGAAGLSGQFRADAAGGEFSLDGTAVVFDWPYLKEPVHARAASGRFVWHKNDADWTVRGEQLRVAADDGHVQGAFELHVPHKRERSAVLRARLDFNNVNGEAASKYYPRVLPTALREWLERAVVAGRVDAGHVIFAGPLREFPFRDGQGRFEVRARVSQGVFEFLPGWPLIENIDADLSFHNAGMSVTGRSGTLNGLELSRVSVEVEDLAPRDDEDAQIRGQIDGAVSEFLGVLYESQPPWIDVLPAGVRGSGQAVLTLNIRVPVRHPKETRLNGIVHSRNAGFRSADNSWHAERLAGEVRFDESGPTEGQMRGALLGGPVSLSVARVRSGPQPGLRVVGEGRLAATGLRPSLGAVLSDYLSGDIGWNLVWRQSADSRALHVAAALDAATLSLPAPLHKPAKQPMSLRIDSEEKDRDTRLVDVRLGDVLRARLEYAHHAPRAWQLMRGRLALGDEPKLGDERGLHVSVNLPQWNVDPWWPVVRALWPGGEGQRAGGGIELARFSAEVRELTAFRRPFGSLAVELSRSERGWSGRVNGTALRGSVDVFDVQGRQAYYLDLDELNLPESKGVPESAATAAEIDPRRWPEVRIKAQRLHALGRAFGALEFGAGPSPQAWRIDTLNIGLPHAELRASGDWLWAPQAGERSAFNVQLTSGNFGAFLSALGFPNEISGGQADISAKLAWTGSPGDFGLGILDGDVDLSLTQGRLMQVKQGTGRLLGIFDVGSLTRYLSLDFSNLFGKGFNFDSISGQATVEKGQAYTRNLAIKGPSAHMSLSGRVGLAAQDLDLEVDVVPRFKEELTVTGLLLGNPAVGAAVLAAQELLKKPLEQGTRISYTVKGAWQNPQIVRVPKLSSVNPSSE